MSFYQCTEYGLKNVNENKADLVCIDSFKKAKADGIQSCLDIASQMALCDQTKTLVKSLKIWADKECKIIRGN